MAKYGKLVTVVNPLHRKHYAQGRDFDTPLRRTVLAGKPVYVVAVHHTSPAGLDAGGAGWRKGLKWAEKAKPDSDVTEITYREL